MILNQKLKLHLKKKMSINLNGLFLMIKVREGVRIGIIVKEWETQEILKIVPFPQKRLTLDIRQTNIAHIEFSVK